MYGGLKRGCLCLRFVPQSQEANRAGDKEMTRRGLAIFLAIPFLALCPIVTLHLIKGSSRVLFSALIRRVWPRQGQ